LARAAGKRFKKVEGQKTCIRAKTGLLTRNSKTKGFGNEKQNENSRPLEVDGKKDGEGGLKGGIPLPGGPDHQ